MPRNDGNKEYYFWMFFLNKHNHQFEIASSDMTNNPTNLKLHLQIYQTAIQYENMPIGTDQIFK